MSVYSQALPQAFPILVRAEPLVVSEMIQDLLDPSREDVPQGSSFAITVDNWDGTWNLWLSKVSATYIESLWVGVRFEQADRRGE